MLCVVVEGLLAYSQTPAQDAPDEALSSDTTSADERLRAFIASDLLSSGVRYPFLVKVVQESLWGVATLVPTGKLDAYDLRDSLYKELV
jgi:hypothetical protein